MYRTKIFVMAMVLVVAATAGAETVKLSVKDAGGTNDAFSATDTSKIGVGMGTGIPEAGIHLKGAAYPFNAVRIEGNETTQGAGLLGYQVPTTGLPLSNSRLGFFLFGSFSAGVGIHAAGLQSYTEGAWTATSTPANFSFWTTPAGGTARVERMRISGAGDVGIGTTAPGQKLEVNGGIMLNTSTAKPACADATNRGTLWFAQNGGVGGADTLQVCAKDSASIYAWRTLY
jgi:hypothetical protein